MSQKMEPGLYAGIIDSNKSAEFRDYQNKDGVTNSKMVIPIILYYRKVNNEYTALPAPVYRDLELIITQGTMPYVKGKLAYLKWNQDMENPAFNFPEEETAEFKCEHTDKGYERWDVPQGGSNDSPIAPERLASLRNQLVDTPAPAAAPVTPQPTTGVPTQPVAQPAPAQAQQPPTSAEIVNSVPSGTVPATPPASPPPPAIPPQSDDDLPF